MGESVVAGINSVAPIYDRRVDSPQLTVGSKNEGLGISEPLLLFSLLLTSDFWLLASEFCSSPSPLKPVLPPFCFWPHVSAIIAAVKATRYFEEQVLRKRPYIKREWCEQIVANPLMKEVQPDGRIRHWGVVPELAGRALRVVTLEDGETLHNAFPDRDFKVP